LILHFTEDPRRKTAVHQYNLDEQDVDVEDVDVEQKPRYISLTYTHSVSYLLFLPAGYYQATIYTEWQLKVRGVRFGRGRGCSVSRPRK